MRACALWPLLIEPHWEKIDKYLNATRTFVDRLDLHLGCRGLKVDIIELYLFVVGRLSVAGCATARTACTHNHDSSRHIRF